MFTDPFRIAALLSDYTAPWWICGGWAIDLLLDRETRPHKDLDVAIPRGDQRALQDYLLDRGWKLEKAIDGRLYPWQAGDVIRLPVHTIWCRHSQHEPAFFEILLNEIDSERFYFRRDQTIRRSRTRIELRAACGLPILAPEITLLYKANNPDDAGNHHDFVHAWPHLAVEQQRWLAAALRHLYQTHPWLDAGEMA